MSRQKVALSWGYLANFAPNSVGLPNWYSQKIGVPNAIWPGLFLANSILDSGVVNTILDKYFRDAGAWESNGINERMGGFNLAYRARAQVAEAVLRNDPSMIFSASQLLDEDLRYLGIQATGPRPDSSFHQHTSYPDGSIYEGGTQPGDAIQWYSGSYGVGYALAASEIISWLQNTPFAFSSSSQQAAVDFLLDGQQWLFRNQSIEPTSTGRSITLNTVSSIAEEVIDPVAYTRRAAILLQSLQLRSDELTSLINRLLPNGAADSSLSGNRSFWNSDAMIQQDPAMMAAVRMISLRSLRPETLQRPDRPRSEGAKSFFLGDGVTTFFQDGKEYGPITGREIFPLWNWTQLPGTTLEQLPEADLIALSYNTARDFAASSALSTFVGSVSNGQTGLASMDYRRLLVNVSAKKSWFFFGDTVLALGAGINAPSATYAVNTTMNQVVLDGPVIVRQANGETWSSAVPTQSTFTNPSWVLHDGLGYVPLGPQDPLVVQIQNRTGDWSDIGISSGSESQDVATLWFDHGVKPSGRSYAYAVVADSDQASMDSFVTTARYSVLANTSQVQAVRDQIQGTTQIAFFQAGTVSIRPELTVTVDQPCLIQIVERPNQDLEISVSDPTQSLRTISLSVSRRLFNNDVLWDATSNLSRLTINLPSGTNGVNLGQTVTQTYFGMPRLSISTTRTEMTELGGSAFVTVSLSAPSTQPVSVFLAFGGSAIDGLDYVRSAIVPVVIPAGQLSAQTWVASRDDRLYEGSEFISIQVASVTNAIELTHQLLEIRVVDDDPIPPTVTLQWTKNAIQEVNDSAYLNIDLDSVSTQPVRVSVAFSGTATNGVDYLRSATLQVVIPAGSKRGLLWVVAKDDLLLDPNETIVADIVAVENAVETIEQLATLGIVDDEVGVAVDFQKRSFSENRETNYLIATLDKPLTKPVRVDFELSGTAQVGIDYTKSAYTYLWIPAGQTTFSLWFLATQDLLLESAEEISVRVTNVSGAVLTSPNVVTTSIADDEVGVTVDFQKKAFSENREANYLVATLDKPLSTPVRIDFELSGTAQLGVDYSKSAYAYLWIPAGQTTFSLWFLAIQDSLVEADEQISVRVTNVSAAVLTSSTIVATSLVDDDTVPPATIALASSDLDLLSSEALKRLRGQTT